MWMHKVNETKREEEERECVLQAERNATNKHMSGNSKVCLRSSTRDGAWSVWIVLE